ncbi:DUF5011 domain-containing protein [Jeotgalibaca sp. MA1X17-3]|uniref:immunoglobulin-like domain-containing protein n=1 Tax=Jeotgalibaca sp. MA1X17-3 TaxID=2908211 RepID=UPI001F3174C5|nr:immunoglobulin-like domain-containing protein [Jeotgalibaca sp. MA1X17-3]UJF15327.1 DUF5011 domain-containing protein [Jeotgalibaca sp. MA1X17-3]
MKKMKSILALSLFLNYFTPLVVWASEVDDVPSEEVSLTNENKVEVKVKEKLLKSLANQDLIISSNIFLVGEEVIFEWKLPEDIEALSINMILENGMIETEVPLIPEKGVHLFEGSFLLEEGSNYSGDWQISEIIIALNEEESVRVSVSDESNPFSNLDFKVIQPKSISTFSSEQTTDTPFSITDFGVVFHKSASLTDQTIDGDIYIGAEAVLTLSNVTVLGDIYVLGALYANEVTSKGTLFNHSIYFEDHPQLVNGIAIVLGNNHFGNITSTNEVITNIPIEFGEEPVKSVDGILTMTGHTLAIADMFVNGHPVEVLPDGSFIVNDIEIQKATTFDVTWATVFGHTIKKSFEVDPHIMSPSGVIHHAPELMGVKDLTFSIGEEIDLFENVTATDLEDGDLTEKVEVDDSGLDYTKRGTYFITYRIIDSDGATVEKQATITVK